MIHLLHVDDQRDEHVLLKHNLQKFPGFSDITWINSAKKALDLLAEQEFDCILCDFQMPGMDGLEFLTELRKRQNNTPLIFLTGQGSEMLAAETFRAGADDYFPKEIGIAHYNRLHNSILRAIESRRHEAQSRRSEELYRTTVDALDDAVHLVDRNIRLVLSNERFRQLCGKAEDAEGIIGKPLQDICPYLSDKALDQYREVIRTGKPLITQDETTVGETLIITETRKIPLVLCGVTQGVLTSVIDITDRKKTEQNLLLNSLTLSQIMDLVLVTDLEGYITYANEAECRALGRPLDDLIGKHVSTLGEDSSSGPTQEDILQETLEAGEWRGEVTNYRSDGSALILDCRTRVVRDSEGKPIALCGISTDITERKRSEQSILHERDFSSAILNSMPGIFYVFDRDGRFLRWNSNLETVSGYSGDEIRRIAPLELFGPEDKQLIKESIDRVFEKEFADAEADFISKDGKATPYYFTGARTQIDGKPCIVGMGIDISERRQAESALRESEAKYRQLVENSPAVVYQFEIAADGEITFPFISDTITDLVGISAENIMQDSSRLLDLIHLDDREKFFDGVLESRRTLKPYHARFQYTVGEEVRWVEARSSAKATADGGVHWDGFLLDITPLVQAEEAVRESEANFRTFYDSMTDMVFVASPDGNIINSNPALTRCLGYNTDEITSMRIPDLYPADVRDEAHTILEAMLRGEREYCPLSLITKDGSLVPVETHVCFGNWNGEECIFGISKDLSAEKEAQRRFELLFQSNPAPMALTSLPDRKIIDVNSAFLDTLGYERDEILGSTSKELGIFLDPERHEAAATTLIKEQHFNEEEMWVRCKDGTIKFGSFSGEIISVQGRDYFLTVMLDISDLKRVEETLRESEQRMEMALRGAELGTWDWDYPSGVVIFNERWANMMGYELEEIKPAVSTWQNLIHPEDYTRVMDCLNAHLRGEEEFYECEHRLRHKLGTWVWILDKGKVIKRDAEGKPLRICGTHLDITKRKHAEEELLQSRDRLEQQTELLAITNLELDRFAHTVSHDLQAPLRRICCWIDALQEECSAELAESHLDMLNRISANSREMQQLVDALLEFARSIRGEIERVDVDLSAMARDILESLKEDYPQRQVVTRIEDGVRCQGDPRLLKQVLQNLLRNAWKFSQREEVAEIEFGTTTTGLRKAIFVRDNGVGFDPAIADKLFTAFQRLHSDSDFEGQGIGLATSQRIIHRHGGNIWAEGEEGKGATIYFTL